ncbi:MAG TPA: RDD family protein [Burkholderiaceae bacterium]|nr:RDD family protein [Burkholderiaceae bacterium]
MPSDAIAQRRELLKRKPLCTVLMPFDPPGRARFATLEKIGEEMGFRTMRVAQYYSSGMILEEIVRSIRDAHLIIADLTRGNPNVCYELGIAHALGRRVFLVAEDSQSCRIDFGALQVCQFDQTQVGWDSLRVEIRRFVDTPGTLSPIDVFSDGPAVAGQPLLARRFAAFVLDVVFAVPLTGVLFLLTERALPESVLEYLPGAILLAVFELASIVLGTTPGQRVLGLKVTRLDRSKPSRWQRVLRPIAGLLSLPTLGVGFVWAVKSPRYQALHDTITRTLVMRRSPVEAAGDNVKVAQH